MVNFKNNSFKSIVSTSGSQNVDRDLLENRIKGQRAKEEWLITSCISISHGSDMSVIPLIEFPTLLTIFKQNSFREVIIFSKIFGMLSRGICRILKFLLEIIQTTVCPRK